MYKVQLTDTIQHNRFTKDDSQTASQQISHLYVTRKSITGTGPDDYYTPSHSNPEFPSKPVIFALPQLKTSFKSVNK